MARIIQKSQADGGVPRVRLDAVRIKNYRAFENVELELVRPRLLSDTDAYVVGSRNGVGKTSLLEAIALTLAVQALGRTVDLVRTPWGATYR